LHCGALHPEVIGHEVRKQGANIGFSFDGDGDRVIACNERGEIADGDHIMMICAKYLKSKGKLNGNLLVVTEMSNFGLRKAACELGIELDVTEVGDRYVAERIEQREAALGGESSGHIIFRAYHTTGDGLLSALQLLTVMQEEKLPLSALMEVMQKTPQVILNIKVSKKPTLSSIPEVKEVIKECEDRLQGRGRVLVRYSGTQPLCRVMVEGEVKEEIEELAHKIARIISRTANC
jgi:phosphoglucosamine mutase